MVAVIVKNNFLIVYQKYFADEQIYLMAVQKPSFSIYRLKSKLAVQKAADWLRPCLHEYISAFDLSNIKKQVTSMQAVKQKWKFLHRSDPYNCFTDQVENNEHWGNRKHNDM